MCTRYGTAEEFVFVGTHAGAARDHVPGTIAKSQHSGLDPEIMFHYPHEHWATDRPCPATVLS